MTCVADLAGADLAMWVALATGLHITCDTFQGADATYVMPAKVEGGPMFKFEPQIDWAQGGPLIDEHAIGFNPISDAEWLAEEYITGHTGRGPTPLIAAMRALVASVYGDEV